MDTFRIKIYHSLWAWEWWGLEANWRKTQPPALHNLFAPSVSGRLWRRKRQIFFTSSMPRALSTARSFWQRSDSCSKMFALSFIRAQMTNGKPKRFLYSSLRRAMRSASPEVSTSIPAPACSWRDSRVKVPLCRSLPARSGWHLRIPSLPAHTTDHFCQFRALNWYKPTY